MSTYTSITQRIKLSIIATLAVFMLGTVITGGLMIETEADVSAAPITEQASTLATTSGSTKCKPGYVKKSSKCIKLKCKTGYVKKSNKCVKLKCKTGYVKKNNKCIKSKAACKFGKITTGKNKGACKPKPVKVSSKSTSKPAGGDGDCTSLNYRDDQGFKCNPNAADRKTCNGLGGHAILSGSKPYCIKKGVKCGTGWREVNKENNSTVCLMPDGTPGARVVGPGSPSKSNADCITDPNGKDDSGFQCSSSEPRASQCRSIGGTHLVTLSGGKPMCVYNDNRRMCPTAGTYKDAINGGLYAICKH